MSWRELHQLFEADSKLKGHLRKAPKLSYSALHPGNKKQCVNTALAIFHETTIAALRSFFPEKEAMANFLELIWSWWTIVNSKNRLNKSNSLGNAIVADDGKTDFFRLLADYFEEWCGGASFLCLTPNTSAALVRTLRAHANLIEELLFEEGYDFVLSVRLQSDPLERRFSQYRQMSGGHFFG